MLRDLSITVRSATRDEFESELQTWRDSAGSVPEAQEWLDAHNDGRTIFVWIDAVASHDRTADGETEVVAGQLATLPISQGMTETNVESELEGSGALPAVRDQIRHRLAEDSDIIVDEAEIRERARFRVDSNWASALP